MDFDTLAGICLTAVTSSATLGVTVGYLHKSGCTNTAVDGVWNNQTEIVDPNTEAVITTNQPRICIKISDLDEAPIKGDKLTRDGTTYRVQDVQLDGHGGAELFLKVESRAAC